MPNRKHIDIFHGVDENEKNASKNPIRLQVVTSFVIIHRYTLDSYVKMMLLLYLSLLVGIQLNLFMHRFLGPGLFVW